MPDYSMNHRKQSRNIFAIAFATLVLWRQVFNGARLSLFFGAITDTHINKNNTKRTRNAANKSSHTSSTSSKNKVQNTTPSLNISQCCYTTSLKQIDGKFTDEYFINQRKSTLPSFKWSGKEKEEWQLIRSKMMNTSTFSVESCVAHWKFTVLDEVGGFYLRQAFTHLLKSEITEGDPSFDYVPMSKYPKCLVLGDSISRGTWVETQRIAKNNSLKLSVQGAPTNCGGFANYKKRLSHWLGTCQWDVVQFNVGMHYHSLNMTEYTDELTMVVEEIRAHSPTAHIIFALTTPSPFDSDATWPNKETCKNLPQFHKSGFVQTLNNAASVSLRKINVTINDRYSIIHPMLGRYQKPCDIHYTKEGYELMARHDLEIFSNILGIKRGELK